MTGPVLVVSRDEEKSKLIIYSLVLTMVMMVEMLQLLLFNWNGMKDVVHMTTAIVFSLKLG